MDQKSEALFTANPIAQNGPVHKVFVLIPCIGVAPIMQYMLVHNKNSNTQGSSPNVVKVIFHTIRNCF